MYFANGYERHMLELCKGLGISIDGAAALERRRADEEWRQVVVERARASASKNAAEADSCAQIWEGRQAVVVVRNLYQIR